MNPPTPPTAVIDAVDAVELAEICDLVADWLAVDSAAATSYDRYIGQPGQAGELAHSLRRHANHLTGTPEAER